MGKYVKISLIPGNHKSVMNQKIIEQRWVMLKLNHETSFVQHREVVLQNWLLRHFIKPFIYFEKTKNIPFWKKIPLDRYVLKVYEEMWHFSCKIVKNIAGKVLVIWNIVASSGFITVIKLLIW